ncbi:hypothetical protein DYD21_07105 [Rhodohalobacter sp. SW132]|nr:hypothetical protein DYD21_07105 [Rhodohalobacter sp. SW132]
MRLKPFDIGISSMFSYSYILICHPAAYFQPSRASILNPIYFIGFFCRNDLPAGYKSSDKMNILLRIWNELPRGRAHEVSNWFPYLFVRYGVYSGVSPFEGGLSSFPTQSVGELNHL